MALFTKWCLDILIYIFYYLLPCDMETAQKIVKNSIKENRLTLKVSSLR